MTEDNRELVVQGVQLRSVDVQDVNNPGWSHESRSANDSNGTSQGSDELYMSTLHEEVTTQRLSKCSAISSAVLQEKRKAMLIVPGQDQ